LRQLEAASPDTEMVFFASTDNPGLPDALCWWNADQCVRELFVDIAVEDPHPPN